MADELLLDHPLNRSVGLDPDEFAGLSRADLVGLRGLAAAQTLAGLTQSLAGGATGIDTSKWNHYLDFPVIVEEGGVDWYATKATQAGTTVDPMWERNRAGAESVPFRARLAYHWLSPTVPVSVQADHFVRTVGSFDGTWRPMCDVEQDGVTASMAAEWCDRVEQHAQVDAAAYSGVFVAGGTVWKSTLLFNGRRPRILAAYTSEARMRQLVAQHGGGHMPDVWQNLGEQGRCPGVGRLTPTGALQSLPCDNDVVLDWTKFDALCGSTPEEA